MCGYSGKHVDWLGLQACSMSYRLTLVLQLVAALVLAVQGTRAYAEKSELPRLQSIESAVLAATASPRAVPVLIRGIVVLNGHGVIIEDRTGATEVSSADSVKIALGDEVEVSGEMSDSPTPVVQQAHIRRLWGGSMPLPLSITPDQAAGGENQLFLVQTEAKLVGVSPAGLTGVRLALSGGHQSFSAVLPDDNPDSDVPPKSLQLGATLRLTGVLMVNQDPRGNHEDAFTLQLRTPDDIELAEGPSWWTRGHLLLIGGAAVILILIGINGYYRITHERFRAVAEERANIARDIHDTLAQGFAGITLQLEAAEQMMDRDPVQSKAFLREGLQLVRHSRDESHLSIQILRALSRTDRLDVLISHCIEQVQPGCGPAIRQQVLGEPASLSYNIVNQLFRIGQEAITNSVRHANARTISVRTSYGGRQVLLEVEDDGEGFDPARAAGLPEGHFGLTGMRERAAAIDAEYELQSDGSGTRVRVRVLL